MVAFYCCEDQYGQNPRTLGDWVKNFRLKKMQMKRKLRTSGGELRVCAILSTALMSAELELRRKQQERFQKWLEFQAKIKNHELQSASEPQSHHNTPEDNEIVLLARDDSKANLCNQSDEINNLWKCELSELDNFMRSMSSSNSNNNNNNSKSKYSSNDLISTGGGGCHQQGFIISQPLTSSQQTIRVSS